MTSASHAPLRVLTLSGTALGGGAEAIARTLTLALGERGIPAHLRANATAKIPPNSPFSATPFDYSKNKTRHRLRHLPATTLEWLGVDSFVSKEFPHLLDALPFEPNILHCHNIRDHLLRIEDLPSLCAQFPVVWTLHDMWPLAGHCAYSLECERWRQQCGRCPHRDVYFPIRFDCSRLNLWRRKRVYQQIARELPERLQLVSPSEWLANIARQGIARDLPVHVIPNGIDTHTFCPPDPARREALRQEWGVPNGAVVALFAANQGGKNLFKDYDTFICAARQALDKNPSLFFVAAGGDKGRRTEENGLPVLGLGHIASPETMAGVYGAADIFVHATRADNLPLAPLEAMACGTPVIGSRIGGVPEVIADGETGLLCEGGNADDMAGAILRLAESAEFRRAYAKAGAMRVLNHFTREMMVDAYLRLYEGVLQPGTVRHGY